MLTPRRLSRMGGAKLSMAEALQWLCRAEPSSKDLLEALQTWTAKTPARVALTQARTYCLVTFVGLWVNLFWAVALSSVMLASCQTLHFEGQPDYAIHFATFRMF